LKQEIEEMRK